MCCCIDDNAIGSFSDCSPNSLCDSVMGDHLALLVDRLLTESTLEATIESRKQARNAPDSASSVVPIAEFVQKRKGGKLVECRICQEEDEASNMEVPCSCCGSLKV